MPVGLRPRRIGAGRSQEEAVNEVDLANQLVEEVAASESEMVRQTMDQVIQSHRAIIASLARLEEDQRVTRDELANLAEATGGDLNTIVDLVEERSEWSEERLFDLVKRVIYLTEQLASAEPVPPPFSGEGKAAPGGSSATGNKRASAAQGHGAPTKAVGWRQGR